MHQGKYIFKFIRERMELDKIDTGTFWNLFIGILQISSKPSLDYRPENRGNMPPELENKELFQKELNCR